MSNLKITKRGGTWQVTGTVAGQRIRQSLCTRDRGTAQELAADLEARIWKRHTYGEEAVRTFEEAALSYLEQGGERRFVIPILTHFKGRAIGRIKPADVRDAAFTVLPNAANATRNRQVITPTRAIINHAADLGWCQPIRVTLFTAPKSHKHQPVDRAWLREFMAQADADDLPHLATIVLFMNQTGARRSEAVHLMGQHVDLDKRIAVLVKTKTDTMSVRHLTAELVLRIAALDLRDDEPVFRYTEPSAVNRRIKAVCARADIPYRPTHSAGRHSFGTNAMNTPGVTIKEAMDAGGWASAALFLQTYVHTEDASQKLAAKFDDQTGPIGTDMTQAKGSNRYRFGTKAKS